MKSYKLEIGNDHRIEELLRAITGQDGPTSQERLIICRCLKVLGLASIVAYPMELDPNPEKFNSMKCEFYASDKLREILTDLELIREDFDDDDDDGKEEESEEVGKQHIA